MSKWLAIEDAALIVSAAFLPLRCATQVEDYEAKLSFRVFDEDEALLRVEGLLASQVRDPRRLEEVIRRSRENLEGRGYHLKEWVLPN